MTYIEIGQTATWEYDKEGDLIEGTFKRTTDGKFGLGYIIETSDGERLVWGTAVLTRKMTEIKEGNKVRITYGGELPPKVRGQNPTKLFKVERNE